MKSLLPIATDRLIVRSFRAQDAEAFHGWRDDGEVARYTLWDYPYGLDRARAFCNTMAAAEPFPDGGWYQLMIEDKATGQGVGDIGVGRNVHDMPGAVFIGYSLSRAAHGKGYMTEALKGLLPALARAFPGVHTFAAELDARNGASARVLERAGFHRLIGDPRQVFVKGEWCDELDYRLEAEGLR